MHLILFDPIFLSHLAFFHLLLSMVLHLARPAIEAEIVVCQSLTLLPCQHLSLHSAVGWESTGQTYFQASLNLVKCDLSWAMSGVWITVTLISNLQTDAPWLWSCCLPCCTCSSLRIILKSCPWGSAWHPWQGNLHIGKVSALLSFPKVEAVE